MWTRLLGNLANRLVSFSVRRAWLTVAASLLLTAGALWYCVATLEIDTDNADLLSAELPFRQDDRALKKSFPQLSNNIVVVVDAPTPDQADDAARRLLEGLKKQPDLFPVIFDPMSEPYFRNSGLLFLEEEKLAELLEQLVDSQAFIGSLAADPSLRGLFELLTLAVTEAEKGPGTDRLTPFLKKLTEAVRAHNEGAQTVFSWQDVMGGGIAEASNPRRFLVLQPALDYGSLAPAGAAMTEIRRLAEDLRLTTDNGFRVRLTGGAPMEQEELASVAEGMGLAGAVSVVLVITLLFAAFRSGAMVVAAIAALFVGLIWTAGFAAVAVGRFNLISVAFAVLFIGLSVDFAIHLALRIREEMAGGRIFAEAGPEAAGKIAGALGLCALAAAIAFFSFLPTDYAGLAELGIIAGAGMFIALIANLTFFPALLQILPIGKPPRAAVQTAPATGSVWQVRHGRTIVFGAAVLAAGAAIIAADAQFDFDPLNLRNPETESVATMMELMDDAEGSLYSADVLAANRDEAIALIGKLRDLSSVDRTISAANFVPGDQKEKLALIEEAGFLILPALSAPRKPVPGPKGNRVAIDRFIDAAKKLDQKDDAGLAAAVKALAVPLAKAGLTGDAGLLGLEKNLTGTLSGRLDALADGLSARQVGIADLPASVRDRYIDSDGRWRIEVYPAGNARDAAVLSRFVEELQSVAPRATGSPVIIVEAGRVVIGSFVTAAVISVVAISTLVLVLLGGIGNVLLVFAPLTLAALLTGAFSVLVGLPFNFANIIVLPLLFGLGVASAIHLVMRSRDGSGAAAVFGTSTPRAVFFSALTTIGSFASIALSSHPGTASMGVLLAVAIGFTLACTVILLPALLSLRGRRAKGA